MRFDDRLTTVLAGDIPAGAAAVAQYRQLIDILGQIAGDDVNIHLAPALARVHALRGAVSDADRLLTVQCLSGRLVSPVLVQYLASEQPVIASAAIRAARLGDDQWAALVPSLPIRARGFLRNRRDLGNRTRTILDQLGLYDTALPDAAAAQASAEPGYAQTISAAAEGSPAPDPIAQAVPAAEEGGPPLPTPANDPSGPQSIGDIVKRIEALQEVRLKQAMDERPATKPEDWNRLGGVVQGHGVERSDKANDPTPDDLPLAYPISVAPSPAPAADATPEPGPEPEPAPEPTPTVADNFQFATGTDGSIMIVDGIALGSVYGLSLALPAMPGARGVDAAVATAFTRRMPVRGGRADLGMIPALSGEWRIDADPCFDRASGRFTGYSGVVRRPMAWESAGQDGDDTALTGRDGLRQIVHELRTPLNAIMGFSEIIEQQLFGPVAREYRDMALRIGQDARQLLSGFDDLDTALRLDRNALDDPSGCVPLGDLIDRLATRVQPLLTQAQASIEIATVPSDAVIAMSPQALDRILPRLTGALIGSCQPGESLDIWFSTADDTVDVNFSRPRSLAGLDEAELFDVDRQGAGQANGGPLLGLGFCLRLVRNLLAGHAGRMQVTPHALCLTLPMARISAELALP